MIVTFGEIMMRLSPPGYQRINQTKSYDASFGGGEANVAVSLSLYGKKAKFVSKLPENPVGKACDGELKRWGVDTSDIVYSKSPTDRMGIYFCEKGASQRASVVVYDRANSAISNAKPEDFDWESILSGAEWFHFTGITPALSDDVAETALKACETAKKLGIKISCDLNYRKKLWSKEKAGAVMAKFMPYIELLIANEEDAYDVFGISADKSDITKGEIDIDGYKSVAKKLYDAFGIPKIAITLRESISASQNNWSALLLADGQYYVSKKYFINIVDRVGGGDSFGAGLIFGILEGMDSEKALEYAVAASALKHTVEGDFNIVTKNEVLALMGGDGSGRVQR